MKRNNEQRERERERRGEGDAKICELVLVNGKAWGCKGGNKRNRV